MKYVLYKKLFILFISTLHVNFTLETGYHCQVVDVDTTCLFQWEEGAPQPVVCVTALPCLPATLSTTTMDMPTRVSSQVIRTDSAVF